MSKTFSCVFFFPLSKSMLTLQLADTRSYIHSVLIVIITRCQSTEGSDVLPTIDRTKNKERGKTKEGKELVYLHRSEKSFIPCKMHAS